MSWPILISLLSACAVFLLLERRGLPVTLELSFKGDIKREGGWFAQYGQAACTLAVVWVVSALDKAPPAKTVVPILVTVFGASIVATLIKRLLGRVRPRRPNAGQFLGPTLRHDNSRESFPSSHSAAAVALSVALSALYPQAAGVFWTLAIVCATLRYLMDAHWPSDVLAGVGLGYGVGWWLWGAMGAT